MTADKYSPFKRGADDGLWFGIYLTVLFFAAAFSMSIPYSGFVSTLMALGVPVIIYIFLRRSYVKDLGTTQFSSLWMQGIVTFFCGSAIMALAAFIFMRWISPDFLYEQTTSVIKTYNELDWEQGKEIADTLQKILDRRLLPSPIQIAMEMIWLGVFSGSLLSIIVSLFVQIRKVKTKL